MRRAALVAVAALALTLAGCADEPAEAPAVASPTSSSPSAAAPTTSSSTPVAVLPPAPPLDTWVVKGNDFQQTLDLKMQTAMIEQLNMSPADADETAARDLAYYVCRSLRQYPSQPGSAWVQAAYPNVESFSLERVAIAAQFYCLDTVEV